MVASILGRILAMRGAIGVGKLGPAAGLSYRQALRRFQTSVGVSPKELARLVRVRWACIKALSPARPSWPDVSIVTGFSDQSHLVREFSGIFGWPPALVREYLAQIEHVHVEMSRRCLTRPERSVPDLSSLTLGRVPVARITKSRHVARNRPVAD